MNENVVRREAISAQSRFRIRVAALSALPLLGVAVVLGTPPVGGLALDPAWGTCANANSHPRHLTRDQARTAVVCVMNNRRAARGKGSLATQSGLRKAAGRHTRRMRRSNCFAHQCPGENDLARRVHSTSYLPCGCSWGVGENIAWGIKKRGTPKRVVKAWMHSRPHREVLLNGAFEHVGVGVKWGSPWRSGRNAGTYTATFGFKR
jgi:uncharacterized protein YkwD